MSRAPRRRFDYGPDSPVFDYGPDSPVGAFGADISPNDLEYIQAELADVKRTLGTMLHRDRFEGTALVNQLAQQVREVRALVEKPPATSLPSAKLLGDIAKEAIRQRVRNLDSSDFIHGLIERTMHQSVESLVKKEFGVDQYGSVKSETVIGRAVLDTVKSKVFKIVDGEALSESIASAMQRTAELLASRITPEWTETIAQQIVGEFEKQVADRLRTHVESKIEELVSRVLSETVDAAIREEIPAIDQLNALLQLGFSGANE